MRRFRPGGQLDAALITASSVAIIGFARGASTDMQMAAPLCIGMLGWYAWYETGLEVLALRPLLLRRGGDAGQGAHRAVPGAVHHPAVCGAAAGVVGAAADDLGPRRADVPGDGAALVHRGAAGEPDVRGAVLRRAQPGTLCHQPLPAPSAGLVLPGGGAGGPDAVDGDRHPRAGGGDRRVRRRVEGAAESEVLPGAAARGRRVSRVSCAVGAVSHRLLHLLQVEAAGIYSAVDSSAHHSDRRLSEPHPARGAAAVAAVVSCGGLRAGGVRDCVGAAAHGVRHAGAAGQMARNRRRGGVACVLRRGADDPHRRHCAGAQRHVVSGAGGAGVSARLPWQGPGSELFGPPAGARDAAEGAGGASGRGPGRQARHGLRPRLLSQRAAGRVRQWTAFPRASICWWFQPKTHPRWNLCWPAASTSRSSSTRRGACRSTRSTPSRRPAKLFPVRGVRIVLDSYMLVPCWIES